jgi:hypothetical protein
VNRSRDHAQDVGRGRWLATLLVFLLVAVTVVISIAAEPARGLAGLTTQPLGEVDPRVPGPDNPVGPTDWDVLVDESAFIYYEGAVSQWRTCVSCKGSTSRTEPR